LLPNIVKPFYSDKKYIEARDYHRASEKPGMIKSILSLLIILFLIGFGGFNSIDLWVRSITENPYWMPLLFFGVLFIASDILGLPFDIYATFNIEEKFGFNKTTPKTFILDKIKGLLLAVIIGGGLLLLIIFIYQKTQDYFWILAWAVVSGFSLFMALFYTKLLLPIFNKLTPIEEGELKDAIDELAQNADFNLENIFVMDGSKRSTKANAFFSGLGKQKSIILYDTLIEQNTTEELLAVLAHEIGHYKLKHIPQSLFLGLTQSFLTFFLLGLSLKYPVFSQAIGIETPSFHAGLIAFTLLYSPVELLLGLLNNTLSRRNEYQADSFAAKFGLGNALSVALIKMSAHHLSNLYPNKWDIFVNYSHPTLLQRINQLNYKNTDYESVSTTP
jgi:STE24 endopeptidase